MEKTFDKNSADYSAVRPSYPTEIYKHVAKYKSFGVESTLLDLGAGDGIATAQVEAFWHPNITAVEPGESLCNLGKERFNNKNNVEFICSTFQEFSTHIQFDGIYAATAFHWLDPKTKFQQCHTLLKNDGILFLFWNYFSIAKEETFDAIQEIYKEYHPNGTGSRDIRVLMREKIDSRRNEIIDSGYFTLAEHREFDNPLTYSSKQYLKLLRTFPNNNMPEDVIAPFYKAIVEYIDSIGGKIELNIVVTLDIAKKD